MDSMADISDRSVLLADAVDSLESFEAANPEFERALDAIATAQAIGSVFQLAKAFKAAPFLWSAGFRVVGSGPREFFEPAAELRDPAGDVFHVSSDAIPTLASSCAPGCRLHGFDHRLIGPVCAAAFAALDRLMAAAKRSPLCSGLEGRLRAAGQCLGFGEDPHEIARILLLPELAAEMERRALASAAPKPSLPGSFAGPRRSL